MERMKALLLMGLVLGLWAGAGCRPEKPAGSAAAPPATLSSFDAAPAGETPAPAKAIRFEQADLDTVLPIYAELSGRSIIRGANLPDAKITFSNQGPMTRVEILQALDTALAAQGVATVLLGTKYVKVVRDRDAHLEAGPVVEMPPEQLPESSSFVIYVVTLRKVTASQAVGALQPFAKLPNSIVGVKTGASNPASARAAMPKLAPALLGKEHDLLILRDYSSNVKRMLQVLAELEKNAK